MDSALLAKNKCLTKDFGGERKDLMEHFALKKKKSETREQ